ncbi:hypothetical protein IWX46DRAFT_44919 [Phyllosticta citricarpa]|uniref:Secreted protein n=1 Tax=Phyllosticta citricarpa TaxID=55181 RepID=A0ABR1MFK9_9PEZI
MRWQLRLAVLEVWMRGPPSATQTSFQYAPSRRVAAQTFVGQWSLHTTTASHCLLQRSDLPQGLWPGEDLIPFQGPVGRAMALATARRAVFKNQEAHWWYHGVIQSC